jgi:hypothetical protein
VRTRSGLPRTLRLHWRETSCGIKRVPVTARNPLCIPRDVAASTRAHEAHWVDVLRDGAANGQGVLIRLVVTGPLLLGELRYYHPGYSVIANME